MKKYKLCILDTHPVTYRIPLYKKLNNHPKIDLTVYFCSDYSLRPQKEEFGKIKWLDKVEGFKYKFLKNYYIFKEKTPPAGLWNFGIIKEFIQNRYDAVIIYGYRSLTSIIAMLICKILKIPVIFRDEIHFISYRNPLIKEIKKIFLKLIFKIPSAFFYSYTLSKKFYLNMGLPEERLFFHPCAVNNELFQKLAREDKKKKAVIKKAIGIPKNSKIILYVGRFNRVKRVLDIVLAYEKITRKDRPYLLLIGGGELEEKIKKRVSEKKLDKIKIINFVKREELHNYYAIADLFVIASESDRSPKVLNEAMNFSLPVIVSDRVGTSRDLVKHGKNGFIFRCGNIGEFAKYIEIVLKNKRLREKMGRESLKIVSKWNFDKDVEATIMALRYVCKK